MGINIIQNEEWLSADTIIAEQITVGGAIIIISAMPTGSIPSGKRMYFQQGVSPVGWAEVPQATLAANNSILVGTTGVPVFVNTTDFSLHTHSMAAHNHTIPTHAHTFPTLHNHTTINDPAREFLYPGTPPLIAAALKVPSSSTLPVNTAGSVADLTGAMVDSTVYDRTVTTNTTTTFKYFNVILCEKN